MRLGLVFALILLLGHASVAIGGETLLQSGKRITTQVTEARRVAPNAQVEKGVRMERALQPGLAQSGMRKRTKLLIAMGIGAAFAGVAYAIDSGVEDSTPSSKGER